MNKGKYLKLLELQGYTYNPLFNVDGTEIRQSLENQGINNVTTSAGSFGRGLREENNKLTHNVSAYDSGVKEEYNDTTTGLEADHDLPQLSYDPATGAFGETLVGGDKMHNEKYIRQGNIGVTKTQELIEAERQNLKYSIVKEFFDDINAQILVGIY